jgi:hypothetical protein
MDHAPSSAEYQILLETFGVVAYVVKVEIVQKLTHAKDSQICITFVEVYYIHSAKKF